MKKHKTNLRNTQKLIHSYITNPNETLKNSKIIDLSLIKKSHTGLLPQDRLNIYKDMYIARLIEVLEIDYVLLKHILGKKFYKTMCEYIEKFPSKSNTLNFYGKDLPKLFKSKKNDNYRLLFEIATLEWEISSLLFNSEDTSNFTSADLEKIEKAKLNKIKFVMNDSFRLFKFKFPINEMLSKFYNDEKVSRKVQRKANYVALVANNGNVWRYNLNKDEFDLLKILTKGNTLESSLEKWTLKRSNKRLKLAESNFQEWFAKWIEEGFFKLIYV